jgi:DNA-binding CsgD family transcriptional regulator
VNEGGQLVSAIKTVANGGSVIGPKVVEELVSAKRRREHSPLNELTPRELEVLALVAEGRSNAAIAESLDLTKRAVEKHINSIFAKLDFQGGVAQQASQGHASVPQRDHTAPRALGQVTTPRCWAHPLEPGCTHHRRSGARLIAGRPFLRLIGHPPVQC